MYLNTTEKQNNEARALVAVAMLGARMHFAVPLILADAGLLNTFYTDVYFGNKAWLKRAIGLVPDYARPRIVRQLCDRASDRIPSERIVSFDLLGLWYLLKRTRTSSPLERAELFARMNQLFGKRIVRRGIDGCEIIWGYNGASLEIFQYARAHGIKCILEQTIAPRRIELELMADESFRWPGWDTDNNSWVSSGRDPIALREESEWALADKIVCGSSFVAESLMSLGVPPQKPSIVPYGVNPTHLKDMSSQSQDGHLRVLFAGEVGLRKGVPYLLEALRIINRPKTIRAKLVGPVALNRDQLSRYSEWCEVVGLVARSQMIEMYRWADVLVLPSICEGSATVTYEAMACALPIITTPNSGSLVRDRVDGFVVPIRDVNALNEKIMLLADDKTLRTQMSNAALERARDGSQESYAKRLLETLALGSN